MLLTAAAGRDAAVERADALEVELAELRGGAGGCGGPARGAGGKRDEAEERARALEQELAELREHIDAAVQAASAARSWATRAAALGAESCRCSNRRPVRTRGCRAGLRAERARAGAAAERDAAVARAAELEPELASPRSPPWRAAPSQARARTLPNSTDNSCARRRLADAAASRS